MLDLNTVRFGVLSFVCDTWFGNFYLLVPVTDMLLELARREKIAGIKPDEDLDLFMKVLELIYSLRCLNFYVIFFDIY